MAKAPKSSGAGDTALVKALAEVSCPAKNKKQI